MVRLIHIAPELPPTVGGVADYTAILSRRLVEVSDGTVEPVLMHAGNQPARAIDVPFPVEDLSGECSATALAQTIDRLASEADGGGVVLLEYSGYGYAKWGVPLWLPRGLRRVYGNGDVPLVTIFHEISASSWKPWTSTFWFSPVQRRIARRLVEMSSAVFVNRPGGYKKLRQWSSNPNSVLFQPVFSNVGEPSDVKTYGRRGNYAVVFCGANEKAEIYSRREMLRRVLVREGIERVVDLGPSLDASVDFPLPIEEVGLQPAQTVSSWLQNAKLGFAHRRLDLLTKSGVMAAYLAHGIPSVVVPNGTADYPPVLSHGETYVRPDRFPSSSIDWARVSQKGYAWYQEHAHSRGTAELIGDQIGSVVSAN